MKNSRTLRKNALWNILGVGLPTVVAALAIPLLLKLIGVERLGILTILWVLVGYFSLFDFGIGRALTVNVARLIKQQADTLTAAEVEKTIKSGLVLTLCFGIVGGLVLYLASSSLSLHLLNISPALQDEAQAGFFVAAVGIPFVTLTSGLRGILEAHERFASINILRIFLGMANYAFPLLITIILGSSILNMAIALVLCRMVTFVAHVGLVGSVVDFRCLIQVPIGKKEVRGLTAFGSWMTLSNIISPIMVTADRFLISNVMGAAVVAYYTVPSEIIQRALVLPIGLMGALFPAMIKKFSANRIEAIALYVKVRNIIYLMMLAICSLILTLGHVVLKYWLGLDFADQAYPILAVLTVGLFFNGISQLPYTKLHADGKVSGTAKLHLFEFVFYVPLLYFFTKYFGLLGAAFAWVFRVLFDWFFLSIMSKEVSNGSAR